MMTLIRESTVERYLTRQVRKTLGGECLKFVSPNRRFVSDRIIIIPTGEVWFVEVKRPGGRLSAGQHRWLKKAKLLNLHTAIVDSKEAVDSFIEARKNSQARTVTVELIDLLAWRQAWLEQFVELDNPECVTPYDHYL